MRRPGIVAPPGIPTDVNLMLSWKPGAITCYYDFLRQNRVFEYKQQNPQAAVIVRFAHPRNWFTDPEKTAVQYAQTIAAKWNELRPLAPYVCFADEMNLYYENDDPDPANQPLYETEQFYESVGWWITRVAQVVKSLAPQMALLTPPFSPGRYEDGSPDEEGNITEAFAGYDHLAEAIHAYFDDTLAFHAYWGNINGSDKTQLQDPQISSWYAFRWRRLLAMCRKRYNINASVVIDEAGNFATYDADFFDQITYFSRQTLSDPRVKALTFALWEDPTFSPGNIFNVWTAYIPDLPAFTQKLAAQPDVTVAATPPPVISAPVVSAPVSTPTYTDADFGGMDIRVMFDDGHIETMPMETYLRGVVPSEMPATWHIEALKAQTIAARSYACNALRRARYLNQAFDIRANPSTDQNYRLDKIHASTDAAIQATKGIVMKYNNQPVDAVFSSNCGGHTLNSEEVFKKADGSPALPTPYLRGVACPAPGPKNGHGVGMCQYGANTLAQMNLTFDKILAYFYKGVTFGPWEYKASEQPSSGMNTIGVTTPGNWTVNIKRAPGFSIIVGNLADQANIPITITRPDGTSFVSMSGSKLEFGPGGFEALVNRTGVYTLQFLGQQFSVEVDGKNTIRLDFKTAEKAVAAPAQSVLRGKLVDQTGSALKGRVIKLQGTTGAQTTVTGADGGYVFENLVAGAYGLTVPDSPISETVTLDGREFKTLNLKLAVTTTSGEWVVETQVRPGSLPLMVGDIGEPKQPITVTSPGGAQMIVVSGGKPEFGPGGFEIYAPEKGIYTLEFLNRQFTIAMEGPMLYLTFRKKAEVLARLISTTLPLSQINALLTQIKTETGKTDIFNIEEV